MFTISGTTISMPRGDTFEAELTLKYKSTGEPYTPASGDTIRFGLKSALNAARTEYIENEPLVLKEISTSDMVLRLAPGDTKELAFGTYRYDIEITFADGKVDTPINSAPFNLLPEVV